MALHVTGFCKGGKNEPIDSDYERTAAFQYKIIILTFTLFSHFDTQCALCFTGRMLFSDITLE